MGEHSDLYLSTRSYSHLDLGEGYLLQVPNARNPHGLYGAPPGDGRRGTGGKENRKITDE